MLVIAAVVAAMVVSMLGSAPSDSDAVATGACLDLVVGAPTVARAGWRSGMWSPQAHSMTR
jgi:hypothetical protein